ncbi:MAG: RDD family protein [Steroidobacter sp.]
MNHSLQSMLLVVTLAFTGLAHSPAFAQQPEPPAPPERAVDPSPKVDIEIELERAREEAADAERVAAEAIREAERERRWHGRNRDNVVLHIGDDSKLAANETAAAVVSIFGSAESLGDVYEAVVAIGGNARASGSVGEAVVALMGDAYVDGDVGEEVIAVMGNVELGPNANVRGDVVSVGGRITRDPASKIGGTQQQIAFGEHFGRMEGLRAWFKECFLYGRPLAFDSDVRWAWWTAFGFLALYVILALLFDGSVKRCIETLEERPAQTVVAAILTILLSPVMMVVLAITIIGIALVPFLGFGLFCAGIFGKAVVLGALGRRITRFTGIAPLGHVAFAVLIGGLIAMLMYTVPVLGFIAYNVLGFIGLGAVAFTLILALRPTNAAPAPAMATAGAPVDATVGVTEGGVLPPPTTQVPPLAPPANPTNLEFINMPRAGFWVRMGALFIDVLLIGVLMAWLESSANVLLVALAGYGALMWKLKGTTVGGIIFNLRVVRTDARDIEWETAIVRALGCLLSLVAAGLGFFWMAFDNNRQTWHDKIAGTIVVRVPKSQTFV